jgi:16S rRNA (uracil1498-N3)-methyltransferase
MSTLAQIKALRLKEDNECVCFDAQNHRALFRIQSCSTKIFILEKIAWIDPVARKSPQIELIQCMAKGNKMDLILQKATELAAHSIQVLVSERSVPVFTEDAAISKASHYQQSVHEAVRQSEVAHIPQILPLRTFLDWIKREIEKNSSKKNPTHLGITFCELEASMGDTRFAPKTIVPENYQRISVLIGPEGGLTPAEIDFSFRAGFVPVHLPGGILRVETAAIVALTLMRFAKAV